MEFPHLDVAVGTCFRFTLRTTRYIGLLAVLPAMISAARADYPAFTQVDYVTARSPSTFEAIWDKASADTVRLALFGDSQETSPGGWGYTYMPAVNYEFWKRYGNVPETKVTYPCSYSNDWLLAGSCAGMTPSCLAPSSWLPGQCGQASNLPYYGLLGQLVPDGCSVKADAGLPLAPYFDTRNVRAQVFAPTSPGSGEIRWDESASGNSALSYFYPVDKSGTLALGLDEPVGQVKSAVIGPFNADGKPFVEIQARSSSSCKTELAGIRFISENPVGVCVQNFAAGGYKVSSVLNNHANAGAMLHAFGPYDAIVLHFGANDAGSDAPAVWKANILALIAMIRGTEWLNDPTVPFILITDPDTAALSSPTQYSWLDQQAGVLADIASADPYVMAINSRRMALEQLGWGRDRPEFATYVADGVHYTPQGAKLLAAIDVATMLGQPLPDPSIPGDANLDGSVDGSDAAIWATNFTGALGPNPVNFKTWPQGDWNGDRSVDGSDIAIWAQNFTGALGVACAAPAVLPEPQAAVSMLLGALGLFRFRRPNRRIV